MHKVYLAGPITGLAYGDAVDWRTEVRDLLRPNIQGLSPMRGKEYMSHLKSISGTGKEYAHLGALSTPRGVLTRDFFDCTRCDMVLANLLGAKAVSIGTVMEIAWAFQARRPVVCVMEPEGNPHEHMMVTEAIGFRVPTLEKAIHVIKATLGELA